MIAFGLTRWNALVFYCLVPTRANGHDTQAALHILSHLAHYTGIARHIGQLVVAKLQLKGQAVHGEAVVMCCIRVVSEGDTLAQDNQDDREEQRQGNFHQRH